MTQSTAKSVPPCDDSCVDLERARRRLSEILGDCGIEPRVREAMDRVPRHRFVPDDIQRLAYEDEALPIGLCQTISQPSLVGLMTERLEPTPDSVVLEVGTGSGYQAAILSHLVREVWTVEVVPELAERAARLLAELGCSNVHVRTGDGYAGWPERAPFDAIIVTAAAPRVPEPLLAQLRVGGHMVIPIENDLVRVTRQPDDTYHREWLCGVSFVPMTGAIRARPRG